MQCSRIPKVDVVNAVERTLQHLLHKAGDTVSPWVDNGQEETVCDLLVFFAFVLGVY